MVHKHQCNCCSLGLECLRNKRTNTCLLETYENAGVFDVPVQYKDVLSHGKNVSAKHPAMYCTDAVKCESLHLITVADLPKSLWKLNLL